MTTTMPPVFFRGITQLTDAADYVEQIQGAFVNGKLVLTYNKRKIDISKENDNGTNNLISKRIDHGKTELKAESVSFDTSKVKAGESLDLTVSVKNQGDKTCTGETVKILKGNTVVLEISADKTILSADTFTQWLKINHCRHSSAKYIQNTKHRTWQFLL